METHHRRRGRRGRRDNTQITILLRAKAAATICALGAARRGAGRGGNSLNEAKSSKATVLTTGFVPCASNSTRVNGVRPRSLYWRHRSTRPPEPAPAVRVPRSQIKILWGDTRQQ
ncbi:hypothetical protein EVAR_51958_1 [Eumeta japonica]|uniref:Uncharacterized protein n=1 Tax=Eumeta variegata TaxID=151549 RepID=A0A4C1Y5V7_EUMVA|nr:hypothetical protein EVAR_51958_1 [Eumeta japonica]